MAYHPFRHLGLKFLSVAIACGLWFAVAGEQTVERTLRAPLAFQNQPDQLELVDNPPAQVDVRVRGAASLVSHLAPGDVVAMLDLSNAKAGRRLFQLTRAQVRGPFGVDVTQVTPATIALLFEQTLTRSVPVVPVVEGAPALGYSAGEAVAEPSTIELIGPESSIRHLRSASTEPVSLAGATRRVRETVSVGVPDPSVRLKSAPLVTVTVPVVQTPVERLLQNVPVRIRGVGRTLNAQAVPSSVSIATRGPRELLDRLAADSITAYVDLAGLGPGRYNLPVRVEPTQSVDVLQTDPATVRVRIR
jgi:YbbR domain-containing protein